MSDAPRDTTLEIRELLRSDATLQGVGVRKLYLLLRERKHDYTHAQVQAALQTVREHVVRQHQPSACMVVCGASARLA
jgi:hypothetical protein